MSSTEATFERGDSEQVAPEAALRAHVEAQLANAISKKQKTLELSKSPWPNDWEVFAWGPFRWPQPDVQYSPGRIVYTGETFYMAIAIWMNQQMCQDIVQHQDKFELSFVTSNMQKMLPADNMSFTCCIPTNQDGPCYYVRVAAFTADEVACLMEMNICARICNCSGNYLPRYAAFVRHVYDFDPETLWPAIPGVPPGSPGYADDPGLPFPPAPSTPGWQFDRPIRFMVLDRLGTCECDDYCGPLFPEDPVPPSP